MSLSTATDGEILTRIIYQEEVVNSPEPSLVARNTSTVPLRAIERPRVYSNKRAPFTCSLFGDIYSSRAYCEEDCPLSMAMLKTSLLLVLQPSLASVRQFSRLFCPRVLPQPLCPLPPAPVPAAALPCRCLTTGTALHNVKMVRRDQRRRECVARHEGDRLRLKAILKNRILPEHLQSRARQDLSAQPRDACISRVRNRCVLTGRGRGVVRDYRLNRMKFRQFADFGMLAGVTRSSW